MTNPTKEYLQRYLLELKLYTRGVIDAKFIVDKVSLSPSDAMYINNVLGDLIGCQKQKITKVEEELYQIYGVVDNGMEIKG